MASKIVIRLQFDFVFPHEEKQEIIFYLSKVSKFSLLNIIGFTNKPKKPNYFNFVTNNEKRMEIIESVERYCKVNNVKNIPELVSREASLMLAEIILSNKEILLDNNINNNTHEDEVNLLKSFLIINEQINQRSDLAFEKKNQLTIEEIMLASTFSSGDLGLYDDNDIEFIKLIYSTIEKVEYLVDFLESKTNFQYLTEALNHHFNTESNQELIFQMKHFFAALFIMKRNQQYNFHCEDAKQINFLNSLVAPEIFVDEDFTHLKSYPLFKIDENTFVIIDFFFAVDKFYKSVRFILKNAFHYKNNLPQNDRSFFGFFNDQFSENFLMKNILDSIFHKKYFVKKADLKDQIYEPDYYVRHNKRIYLFENKDVLIAKEIKSSHDVEKILNTLKSKFLETNGKPIGIGQLVNSVIQIVEQKFAFDSFINYKKNFTIYPILIVHDRIFEIPGLNFILNSWYKAEINKKLGSKYNPSLIKDLTLIDIDTLLFWLPSLRNDEKMFRNKLDNHLYQMNLTKKFKGNSLEEIEEKIQKDYDRKLSPISFRDEKIELPIKLLQAKFSNILKN